jgi:hypothetical protein
MYFYGDDGVNESDLYKELGTLTKGKNTGKSSLASW